MTYLTEPDQVSVQQTREGLLKDLSIYKYHRITSDLYLRGLVGPGFYLLSSLMAIFFSGYSVSWLLSSAGIYLLLWWLRYTHKPPEYTATVATYQTWIVHHWLTIYAGIILWSATVILIALHQRQIDDAMIVVFAATIAFGTATCHSFIMQAAHARICIALLMLPPSLVFIGFIPALQSTGYMLIVYFFYLMANSETTSREYQNQIATEIQLLESRAEIARVSMTDTLTGIANRRNYEYVWNNLWHFAARNQSALAFMIIDLDFFKTVNDSYGHLAGDVCLQHVAAILRKNIQRESDLIARIGGEEFVVILPGTELEQAYAIAEQLRADFEKESMDFDHRQFHITASIGVGVADWRQDTTPDNTFSRVDQACYQAKQHGRNCVVRAGSQS